MVRHAESEWNALGRWQGHADTALSDRGVRHSAEVGRLLGGFREIICSDLRRAVQSAEIIASEAGIESITAEPRLRERNAGAWEGLTWEEIERGWPGFLKQGLRPEGYETEDQLLERVDNALAEILDGEASAPKSTVGDVLIITHGGVIHSLKMRVGAAPSKIPNLSGHWISLRNGTAEVGEKHVLGAAEHYSANAIESALNPK